MATENLVGYVHTTLKHRDTRGGIKGGGGPVCWVGPRRVVEDLLSQAPRTALTGLELKDIGACCIVAESTTSPPPCEIGEAVQQLQQLVIGNNYCPVIVILMTAEGDEKLVGEWLMSTNLANAGYFINHMDCADARDCPQDNWTVYHDWGMEMPGCGTARFFNICFKPERPQKRQKASTAETGKKAVLECLASFSGLVAYVVA